MTTELINRLRDTASKGVSVWGDLQMEAADAIQALQAQVLDLGDTLAALEITKDGAYAERNRLVALLSKVFPSGKKKTAIEGWSEDWHGCVYIDLPTGQASWHYHDSQGWLFEHLPMYQGTWDGHTTKEKYDRIAAFAALAQPANDWKDAVIDELVTTHILTVEHETNPRKAVKDAIAWHCEIALDPSVSSDAQALIDRGKPQPEPVELTDEQILAIYDKVDWSRVGSTLSFARAVLAAAKGGV